MTDRTLDAVARDYQRWPDGVTLTYEVGPGAGNERHAERTLDAFAHDAAILLKSRARVQWQPGDGTNYALMLLPHGSEHWLAFVNPSHEGLLRLPNRGITVDDYARSSAPRGGWSGIRPLLAALGVTTRIRGASEFTIRPADVREEQEARVHNLGYQPFERTDAELGRQVRLLVEAERR